MSKMEGDPSKDFDLFSIDSAAAFEANGLSGLPIYLEIVITLILLVVSSVVIYQQGSPHFNINLQELSFNNFNINLDSGAFSEQNHPGNPLPAIVLSQSQQKQISKLRLTVKNKDPDENGSISNVMSNLNPHPSNISYRCPLLVFANTRSGGQTGELILYRLRDLLHPYQVFDLIKDKGPTHGLNFALENFNNQDKKKSIRILVCGGDGSVSWVLNELEKKPFKEHKFSVGILPLGTGNDLARVLGWTSIGNRFDLVDFLCKLSSDGSEKKLLDRWNVRIMNVDEAYSRKRAKMHRQFFFSNSNLGKLNKLNPFKKWNNIHNENASNNVDHSLQAEVGDEPGNDADEPLSNKEDLKIMGCYLGIGVDAQIALNFHLKRERQPHLFKSSILNKFWYASSGGKEVFLQRFLDFSQKVTIMCDGEEVRIPIGIEGIIVLNIKSYGGGVDLWGDVSNETNVGSLSVSPSASNEVENVDLDHEQEEKFNAKGWMLDEQRRSRSLNEMEFNEMQIEEKWDSGLGLIEAIPNRSKNQNNNIDIPASSPQLYKNDNKPKTKVRRRSYANGIESNSLNVERGDSNDYEFMDSQLNDGFLEVVGVQSSFQLGAAQVGLARPRKLCQGKHLLIHLADMKSCPVQVDGEPFVLKADHPHETLNKFIEVKLRGKADMLSVVEKTRANTSFDEEELVENSQVLFEDVLSWGVRKEIIDTHQKAALEKKLNKKIKRFNSQDSQ